MANTPKPDQVNELFDSLLGVSRISDCWHWKGMSVKRAEKKLLSLVELRGEIAHRVSASAPVYKVDVLDAVVFVQYLAALSHNATLRHIQKRTAKVDIAIEGGTWDLVSFRQVG